LYHSNASLTQWKWTVSRSGLPDSIFSNQKSHFG
jgi:hypothetical protein